MCLSVPQFPAHPSAIFSPSYYIYDIILIYLCQRFTIHPVPLYLLCIYRDSIGKPREAATSWVVVDVAETWWDFVE